MIDEYGEHKTNALAAVAAVAATQLVIFIIIVVKYWEDFVLVARGQGHIPYDQTLKEESDYFQSEDYWKDVNKDEERRKKRKQIIEKAKKETEV